MFEYPKTFIKLKIWKSLSFGDFFSSWKGGGGGCVVKFEAAKVIRQHTFFFSSFLYIIFFINRFVIIFEIKKKDMIVLVHKNHDKRPKATQVHHFCRGFEDSNLVNVLFEIFLNSFACKRSIRNRAHFPKWWW